MSRNAVSRLGAEFVGRIIVFIGYRFPPSDAEARKKLLGAIQENSSKHLELHIVLGANRALPDVVRLQELVRYSVARDGRREYDPDVERNPFDWASKTFQLSTHALFAEDFLAVWDRELLWRFGEPPNDPPPASRLSVT